MDTKKFANEYNYEAPPPRHFSQKSWWTH